jgi:hypothetical protein
VAALLASRYAVEKIRERARVVMTAPKELERRHQFTNHKPSQKHIVPPIQWPVLKSTAEVISHAFPFS